MIPPKRVIGSTVHTKATRVIHKTECRRLYGSLYDKKEIDGKVLGVIPAQKGSKKQASLRVEWRISKKAAQKVVKLDWWKQNRAPCQIPYPMDLPVAPQPQLR